MAMRSGAENCAARWWTGLPICHLSQASRTAEVDGYVGYMEPYATSHEALDDDKDFQEETRNAARALGKAVQLSRAGKYQRPDEDLHHPNPK